MMIWNVDKENIIMNYFMMYAKHNNNGIFTGANRRYIELVNSMARGDNKITMLAEFWKEFSQNPHIDIINAEMDKIKFLPYNITYVIRILEHRREIKKREIDIAVAWGPLQAILFKLCGIKRVVACNREDLIGYKKLLKSKNRISLFIWYFIEALELMCASKIIVQCRYDREALIARHKIIAKRRKDIIHIQINNVNASWNNRAIDRQNKEKDQVITIAFISSFDDGAEKDISRKGNDIFLPAAKRLIEEGYHIRVLTAGGGANLKWYREKYQDTSNIIFKDFCDPLEIYGASDFAVVPSVMDSCPNTLLEALSYGIAAYGSETGGIIDILEDKRYMFKPEENSIYCFLKKIIDDKLYLSDSIAQQSICRRLTFDWGDRMEKLIKEM